MGATKSKALNQGDKEKSFELTSQEFNYLKAMNDARQRIYAEQGRTISAFLYFVAGSRLGYKTGKDMELQFEMDFDDETHTLKITELTKG